MGKQQEARLIERLKQADALLKNILENDGGAYDLEGYQSKMIMAHLGGAYFTPAQHERASGNVWMK
jgi:hypothetical protein